MKPLGYDPDWYDNGPGSEKFKREIRESQAKFGKTVSLGRVCPPNSHCMQWISVKDRLPETCDEYLVWPIPNIDMNIRTAEFEPWNGKWNQDCYNGYDYVEPNVTHWMPLPAPPEDE